MRTITKARAGICAAALLVAALTAAFLLGTAQPAQAYADDTQLTTAASSSSAKITPGVYYIQSELPGRLMLDVEGASKASGANVQLYTSNKTDAQRWKVIDAGDGTYKIRNVGSGKYLDVTGAQVANWTNIQQYKANKTLAQRWKFTKKGTGYIITSALDKNYVLDTSTVSATDKTNVILYKKSGATDQKWWLIPSSASVKSKQVVKDGTYLVKFASAPDYMLDLANGAYANGTNVDINQKTETLAQRWYFKWESDGYYSIRSVASGKALQVAGSNPAARTNVNVTTAKKVAAQRWAIVKNSDGSYTLRSKLTGLALDVAGARADNGTNVRVFAYERDAAQRFDLERCSGIVSDGTYAIYSRPKPATLRLEVPDAETKAGTQIQINAVSDTMAQRYYLRQVNGDIYTIQAVNSGLYLADSSGKVVQKKRSSSKTQRWTVSVSGNGLVFKNVSTGKRMALSGGKAVKETKLVTASPNSKSAQRFLISPLRLVPDGYYTVSNKLSGKMLDVTGNSTVDGANVQVYKANGTTAQGWNIAFVSDGYYKIVNTGSSKALDVEGASKDAKANVQQYTYNKTGAQMWKPELRKDGAIVFLNQTSSMALEAAGKANGANVRQNARIGKDAQGWYLKMTSAPTPQSLSGNTELDNYIKTTVQQNNNNLRACYDWVLANFKQVDHVDTTVLANGTVAKQTTIDYALYAFKNKSGDGYRLGALMKWLAIGCGYTAEEHAGQVPAATGGTAKHGWTEVTSNGKTYVIDTDLALEIGGGNDRWYMFEYANSPIQYTR